MTVQHTIESKLGENLKPHHLEVINESHQHNVPRGSESHFKVVVVSAAFEGRSLVQRHRLVHQALRDELAGPVHALALHAYTEGDWSQHNQAAPESPQCLGGKAGEAAS